MTRGSAHLLNYVGTHVANLLHRNVYTHEPFRCTVSHRRTCLPCPICGGDRFPQLSRVLSMVFVGSVQPQSGGESAGLRPTVRLLGHADGRGGSEWSE